MRALARPEGGIESPLPVAGILDVTVLATEGAPASETVGAAEVFRSAGVLWNVLSSALPAPRFRVQVAAVNEQAVQSCSAFALTPECAIDHVTHADIIIVSAGGVGIEQRLASDASALPWLYDRFHKGAYVAGIGAGAAFLAQSGLLNGKRATSHWALAGWLASKYPAVDWRLEEPVTEDGRLLCSGGLHASMDLSLFLVQKFCGHEIALQCAKALGLSMPAVRQNGYALLPLSRPHSDDKVRKTEEYMQQHFAEDLSIEQLSHRVGLSPRTFIRRFKTTTGRLPGAYLQALRMMAAKEMFELGSRSVAVVCAEIGYEDVGFFRTLFKRHTGMTPTEYRSNFGSMGVSRGGLCQHPAGGSESPSAQISRGVTPPYAGRPPTPLN